VGSNRVGGCERIERRRRTAPGPGVHPPTPKPQNRHQIDEKKAPDRRKTANIDGRTGEKRTGLTGFGWIGLVGGGFLRLPSKRRRDGAVGKRRVGERVGGSGLLM